MKIKAVIIDDEPAMQSVNSRLLNEYFPEIELAGIADSVNRGFELIKSEKPQLVLLDVELNDETGFQLLQRLKPYTFKVVFITGYDTYALKAIKFSASDYILKPVNDIEFQTAIQSAIEEIKINIDHQEQTSILLESIKHNNQGKKMVLKTIDSMHIIDARDIMFCKSDNSYTTFYMIGDEKIMVSKSIREYEDLLSDFSFFRPHQSFLVNLNYVKRIDKSDGGFIIMKDKKEIPVSLRKKKELIQMLEKL